MEPDYPRSPPLGYDEVSFDNEVEFDTCYGAGKLHPVHFGDLFKEGRYKVIRKLGSGSFSTVWLARDRTANTYVALKVLTAESSNVENETRISDHLKGGDITHPGRKHVTTLLDSFKHYGPNGTHLCLTFSPMGPTSGAMFNRLPSELRPPPRVTDDPHMNGRYPFWMVKSMLRQILLGLDFLHSHGVAHGDLQPGNILFSTKDLSKMTEKDLVLPELYRKVLTISFNDKGEAAFYNKSPEPKLGYRNEGMPFGQVTPSVPYYLAVRTPLYKHTDLGPPIHVKISDFGGSFLISDPPRILVTPISLRSPELILRDRPSQAQDIWSFGCLMFQFLTAVPLFSLLPRLWASDEEIRVQRESGTVHVIREGRKREDIEETSEQKRGIDNDINDSHVLQIAEYLGPLPPSFMARYPRSSTYFDKKGEIIKYHIGERVPEMYNEGPPDTRSIEEKFDDRKGVDISDEDSVAVKGLLRWILQIDPAKRPSAAEILAHPWFVEDNA